MVEQQNGRVWVESELGVGSSFFVLLKLAKPGDAEAPASSE
jgi:hypothetical protein